MNKSSLAFVLCLISAFVMFQNLAAAPTADSPTDVTQALYHSAMKNFGFSVDIIKIQRPWLAPELYSRLMRKAKQHVPKGDAPDIEGDVFLNSQELPDKLEVGQATIAGNDAKVEVKLTWPTENTVCTVLLKQVDGNWKVYDVDYGKDGKLTDLLK